jgi:hypothetical protein
VANLFYVTHPATFCVCVCVCVHNLSCYSTAVHLHNYFIAQF